MEISCRVRLLRSASCRIVRRPIPRRISPAPRRTSARPPDAGAQIVCLKELFNAPYFCKAQQYDALRSRGADSRADHDGHAGAGARSFAVVLIVPLFERQAAGVYRNSAAVIDADGRLLGTYRKMHIPDDPLFYEKFYFTPGEAPGPDVQEPDAGFKVWQTRYATIGVLICWDQWYPEAARITLAHGRRRAVLSDSHRLASVGEGRMGRGAGGRLADDPARRMRLRTASTSPPSTASGMRTSRAQTA